MIQNILDVKLCRRHLNKNVCQLNQPEFKVKIDETSPFSHFRDVSSKSKTDDEKVIWEIPQWKRMYPIISKLRNPPKIYIWKAENTEKEDLWRWESKNERPIRKFKLWKVGVWLFVVERRRDRLSFILSNRKVYIQGD